MNKELNDKIGIEVDEIVVLSGSITTESFNKSIQNIINLCADEAIDAANNERNSWQNAGMADIGISSAIEAIEKRMK